MMEVKHAIVLLGCTALYCTVVLQVTHAAPSVFGTRRTTICSACALLHERMFRKPQYGQQPKIWAGLHQAADTGGWEALRDTTFLHHRINASALTTHHHKLRQSPWPLLGVGHNLHHATHTVLHPGWPGQEAPCESPFPPTVA